MSTRKRFMRFVTFLPSGCWKWNGAKYGNRYGKFILNGKNTLAHRTSYSLRYPRSDITTSMVLHRCNYTLCVNPAHLYKGDNSKNQKDSYRAGTSVLLRLQKKGVDHSAARLTSEDLKEIHRLKETMTQIQLANLFCVSQGRISQIINGKYHTHG